MIIVFDIVNIIYVPIPSLVELITSSLTIALLQVTFAPSETD